MKVITTTNLVEILVSDEDFDILNQQSWHAKFEDQKPCGVLLCTGTNQRTFSMSHFILRCRGISFNYEVDHKDRNPFNNQFENLRPATRSQNCANRGLMKNNQTGYKGVCFDKSRNKYMASIRVRGHSLTLGRFNNPVDAAKAYDKAVKRYFGEFAVLNFPA